MIASVALALALLAPQSPSASAPIRIQATDDALTMPERVPSGLSLFTLENRGTVPHAVRFIRLADGHTIQDYRTWRQSGQPIPPWLVTAGGIGAVGPGRNADYIASLEAGSYVVMCDYPSPEGGAHDDKGLAAALQVETGASTFRPPQAQDADVTLRLHDHGFQLTAPISAGRQLFHVVNVGTEPHQALIVRLPEGANEFQERGWFNGGSKGARPGQPIGGIVELAADADAWFRVELTPGRYLLLCAMQEEDGRHFELGMIYRFTIE
ncbi:MAG: hypothetical protein ACHQO8_11705 [Vicinamibacterales bacterium]